MGQEESPQRTSHTLVIGVGSAYRGDDAVGLVVAQRLRAEPHDPVSVREMSRDCATLLELWKDAEAVIIIDAVRSGAEPGTVYRFDAGAQPIPVTLFRSSTHAFGVAEAIELARALQQLPSHLVVYGIEGKNFAASVGLSAEVEHAAGEVIRQVRQEMTAWNSAVGE